MYQVITEGIPYPVSCFDTREVLISAEPKSRDILEHVVKVDDVVVPVRKVNPNNSLELDIPMIGSSTLYFKKEGTKLLFRGFNGCFDSLNVKVG